MSPAESIEGGLEKVYDPRAVEPETYALWERSGAFRSKPDGSPHERTFTIVIPPPNVTGALHLGHALNNTLQDIQIRYHRMRGFNTLWQPGTDHAGIATQAVVERRIREQEGKSRHDLGREELVRRIWSWKDEYEKRIVSQLKLMGCSCDWERSRFTFDEGMSKAVRHMFFKLFKDGLIFRGKRLVNWDTQLQTAVSDDEVYYEAVKGHFWHLKYAVIPSEPPTSVGADGRADEPQYVIIATTRPETMLGDTAVAVHPDPEGFFDRKEAELREGRKKTTGKERVEIEDKLEILAARRASHLPWLIKLRDMARDGRKLRLPLVEREIRLIVDEWADPTLGSGCVKITPAHDPNDYEVGLRHNLPMINVLTPDGKVARIIEADGSVNAHSSRYEDLPFSTEARQRVVTDLEARGLIEAIEDREIELGHSDRSKLPIEPFLSDQWFVRTGEPPTSVGAEVRTCNDLPKPETAQRAAGFSRRGPSDPARLRSPNLDAGAVLVTWTTYGTWLPGDQRGFVSCVPSAESPHPIHNRPGESYDADDPQSLASATERLQGTLVYLNRDHAEVALMAIAGVCGRHGIEPLAVAVMANHVHVLCQTERTKGELLKLFKGGVSHALNARFELESAPRWFTTGGSVRYSKSRGDLTTAIEYVKNQKQPLASWSFDVGGHEFDAAFQAAQIESGEVVAHRESAPTEVGGSLAQSAMDAVQHGRIQVFPSRYAKSYLDWLGEKRDWCISRQLWWGHRIPVWSAGAFSGIIGDDNLTPNLDRWENENRLWRRFREVSELSETPVTPLERAVDPHLQQYCVRDTADTEIVVALEPWGYRQDEDVLDTWFSSALWPFSTLGWPEETPHLKQYYPGSVLCTSRDIITNWVARMVMFGLYAMGEVPFDRVYIHPKILDGRGETMSKSKGNGVDPVDIIHIYGADALRYSMADMTTETQDIRMPVEYLCPHCGRLTDQSVAIKAEEQARKSRGEKLERKLQPADCTRVRCGNHECGKEFATQWADATLKEQLGLARDVSDKFEIGRNFCNKLWNAARFAFHNLEGAPCEQLELASLAPEDRWILARLSQTIRRFHECLATYQFSASVKELRDFFWDCLCDWYIELTKPRLSEPRAAPLYAKRQGSPRADFRGRDTLAEARGSDFTVGRNPIDSAAQQVLAFCLDQSLRLWHPTIPFITERLWQQLNVVALHRGLPGIADLNTAGDLITAAFPPFDGYPALENAAIVETFAQLQDATRAIRDLRLKAGVSPKEKVNVTAVVPRAGIQAFQAHAHILKTMAGIDSLSVSSEGKRPSNSAGVTIQGLRVFVHDISDDAAERQRAQKALADLEKQIAGKETKLANANFVARANPEVVQAERDRLADLLNQRADLQAQLADLAE